MQNRAPAGCAYDTATDAELIADCNPWANRQAGDFMILWDQQGDSLGPVPPHWSGTAPNLILGDAEPLNDAARRPPTARTGSAVRLPST